MKQSILEKLFNGKIRPFHAEQNFEYQKLIEKNIELTQKLTISLSEDQKEIFEQIESAEIGIESETALRNFSQGFKLGLLLGIECVEED